MEVSREQVDAAAKYHQESRSGSLSGTFFWHELVEAVFAATTPAQLAEMLEARVIAERAGLLRLLGDAIEPLVIDNFDDSASNPTKIWPSDKDDWTADRNNWGAKITLAMMRKLRHVYQKTFIGEGLPYVVIPAIVSANHRDFGKDDTPPRGRFQDRPPELKEPLGPDDPNAPDGVF